MYLGGREKVIFYIIITLFTYPPIHERLRNLLLFTPPYISNKTSDINSRNTIPRAPMKNAITPTTITKRYNQLNITGRLTNNGKTSDINSRNAIPRPMDSWMNMLIDNVGWLCWLMIDWLVMLVVDGWLLMIG